MLELASFSNNILLNIIMENYNLKIYGSNNQKII